MHDYTRRRGVEATFTVAPKDAPRWAYEPEALWNAAEQRETRKNSTLAREVELALPSFLSPDDRQRIAQRYAEELVQRYRVAVSVAIHAPGGKGDDRNHHAHILFTTREMTPDGLVDKTRVLDDKKTGPREVKKLRELAADIINEALAAVNSDIRVDHRSFRERGIEQKPTTHLGPAASEMERRGVRSDRGNRNRAVEEANALIEERQALDAAIEAEQERVSSPPISREDAQERSRQLGDGRPQLMTDFIPMNLHWSDSPPDKPMIFETINPAMGRYCDFGAVSGPTNPTESLRGGE